MFYPTFCPTRSTTTGIITSFTGSTPAERAILIQVYSMSNGYLIE